MSEPTGLAVFPGDAYDVADIRAVDHWVGGAVDAVVTFVEAGLSAARRRQFFEETLTPVWDAGYVPVVTWEPFLLGGVEDASLLTPLHDRTLLDEWAKAVSRWVENPGADPRTLVFRPAHEMNGDWYPWSAGQGVTGSAYVALWDALRDAFAEYGAHIDRVTWLWCPNADSATDAPLSAYYPGDDAVDWVGVDGYNWGESRPWSSWQSPAGIFGSAFDRVRSLSARPLVVPEFACSSVSGDGHDPARKSAWITAAFDYFDRHDVRFAGWFNSDKETDWSVCTRNPDSPTPATKTLHGSDYGIYPAFERAARKYDERRGESSQ